MLAHTQLPFVIRKLVLAMVYTGEKSITYDQTDNQTGGQHVLRHVYIASLGKNQLWTTFMNTVDVKTVN